MCVSVCVITSQAVLREVCKDSDLVIGSATLYEEWRQSLEDKAGDKVIKVEDGYRCVVCGCVYHSLRGVYNKGGTGAWRW